jgi:hypothetical protein
MSFDTRFVRSQFAQKGFKIEEAGKDYYCRYYYDGIKTNIRTKIGGHSKKKYKIFPPHFYTYMYQSLFFDSKEQLLSFIECPFTEQNYRDLLIKKGKILLPS